MRKPCVAGNWKMHKTVADSEQLVEDLLPGLNEIPEVDNIICPPFTALDRVANMVKDSKIELGAQNIYWEEQGAYTGEISPQMLAELVDYVIIGHSERRAYFQDTDQAVNKKLKATLNVGLQAILCVGETLEENEAGDTGKVVTSQVRAALEGVAEKDLDHVMVAYEPVWAIGTGKAATPEGANLVIKDYIREGLSKLYSADLAQRVRILYGGSVKPGNAKEFFDQPDIDGALVGGASLKADDFVQITQAAV